MKTILIAACSKNRVIGKNGKIPWYIPGERNRFKTICKGKIVIMGRRTFEEIGHALSYCTILIISKSMTSAPQNCLLANSFEQAVQMCRSQKQIIIAGGSSIYLQSISTASQIILTEILAEFDGDSFFPPFEEASFNKKVENTIEENGIKYRYVTYTRL